MAMFSTLRRLLTSPKREDLDELQGYLDLIAKKQEVIEKHKKEVEPQFTAWLDLAKASDFENHDS